MQTFAAGDLTRQTGDLFEAATIAPVAITKHRKPRFVVMSYARYSEITGSKDPQRAVAVNDMPEYLGEMLDTAVDAYLDD